MKKLWGMCLGLLLITLACGAPTWVREMEKVEIGMSREQIIGILSETSWYHQPCPGDNIIDDLFFYGEHTYDEANIVIVTSDTKTGSVTQVGTFESYAWHTAYAKCIERDKFDD